MVLLPSFDTGGAENYALRLIQHAGHEIYEWHVTSGNLKNRTMEPAFQAAGVKVHHVSPGFANPLRALNFHRFLRKHRFDVVMSLNGVFGGVPLALARLAGVPVRIAWHRRSTPAYQLTVGRRLYTHLSLALLGWVSTRILSNSQAAFDQFHGKQWRDSSRYEVIPNGVDAKRFSPRPEIRSEKRRELGLGLDDSVIGHVGRFDPAKDHETLFAIVRALRAENSAVRLLMVGTGTDSEAVRARLDHYGIADISLGLGVRGDVHLLYNAMDVFVFPSVTEGQPNALIEAMLCGVRIVAADIPGIREAVPPPLISNLFPPRDVLAASRLVRAAMFEPSGTSERLPWLQERYDLERNLDLVLNEIKPTRGAEAYA
ncbi:MAG: glycosyltransferase [Wenzhouxiangella sp.]